VIRLFASRVVGSTPTRFRQLILNQRLVQLLLCHLSYPEPMSIARDMAQVT